MATANINLKTLEFQDIKNELVTYFQSTSDFSSFDFSGSVLSSIMDLLAYNTFYQILFQNIFVNEMFLDSAQKLESLISHGKLLGYVVPGKISSTATIKVSASAAGIIPAYSSFRGSKNNSETRLFYNIESQPVSSTGTGFESAEFTIYEAERFVNQAPFTFNSDTQSVSISDTNIDFRTIKVEVSTDGGSTFTTYKVGTSTEPTISQNDNVCFIERTATGYKVVFTGTYDSTSGLYQTSNLPSTTKIKLTYAVPSGLNGNDCSSFALVDSNIVTNGSVTSISGLSKNGRDAPSIDSLKLNMPRVFSASSRVVTADDIKSFLVENGFTTSINNVVVVGGEDLTPAELGKVYYKITTPLDSGQKEQTEILLNEKGMLGISYEYSETIG